MARKAGMILLLLGWWAGAAAQDQAGKIIFYHESHFLNGDYKPPVFCDGVELGRIAHGSYLEALAPPGRHVCVAESADAVPITNEIAPGDVVYLRVDITPGATPHAFLIAATEAEYRRQKKLKLVATIRLTSTQPIEVASQTPPSAAASSDTLLPGSAFLLGVGGISYPRCKFCPDPRYTRKARDAHLEGIVRLQATIGKDGIPTDIKIVKGLGLGLDEQAVNAVQSWRFAPALGPNGDPIATMVPIEITFRLLN